MRLTDRNTRREVSDERWYFAPPARPRRSRGPVKAIGVVLALVALVALAVWGGTVSYRAHRAWVESCHAAGGHVTSTSDVRVGTAIVNGKITTVVTTDTTYYCLGDGNRLLGIRS